MKICHVISGYFRNDARVFHRQCKSLQRKNNEVIILSNDGEGEETLDGVKIFSCNIFFKRRILVLLFATFQFFFKAKKINADVYQLHSPELIFLGLLLKINGKKIIYDAHEDLPRHVVEKEWLFWIPITIRKAVAFLIEKYLIFALRKYDEVITPHHHVNDQFIKQKIKSTLVTNFPIIKTFKKQNLKDYLKKENVICYTGTVYSYSNQEEILQAIYEIKNVQYKVAGYFEPSHLKALSHHKGFESLEYVGRIPWNKLNDFYEQTTMGIVIYDYKLNLGNKLGSFGTNKIFEYMEASLPIICTNYSLWEKIIEEYKCGIAVNPGSKREIKEAIEYLIKNKTEAYEFGQNGRKAVEEKFNWNLQERDYLKVIYESRNR